MKIYIKNKDLQMALRQIKSAVSKPHDHIEILSCIKLAATDTGLELMANNLDVIANIHVASVPSLHKKDADPITKCVKIKNFEKAVKSFNKNDTLTIDMGEKDKKGIVVSCESTIINLDSFSEDEFPEGLGESMKDKPIGSFKIPASELLDVLKQLSPCISVDEGRYYLNGIFFCEDDGRRKAVATDGYQMGVYELNAINCKGKVPELILPFIACKILTAVFKDSVNDEISVRYNKAHISFTGHKKSVISKLVDGTFPNWQRIVKQTDSQESLGKFVVEKEKFMSAMSIVQQPKSAGSSQWNQDCLYKKVFFTISDKGKELELKSYSDKRKDTSISVIPIKKVGKKVSKYKDRLVLDNFMLQKLVKNIQSDEFQISVHESGDYPLFRYDSANKNIFHVQMGMANIESA